MQQSEIILLAGSLAVGAMVSAGIIIPVMIKQRTKAETALRDDTAKSLADLKSNYQQERETVAREHAEAYSQAQQALSDVSADLGAKETELNLLTSSEFEFGQFDTSRELYEAMLGIIKRSFPEVESTTIYKLGEQPELVASTSEGPSIPWESAVVRGEDDHQQSVFERRSTTILQPEEINEFSESYPNVRCITILSVNHRDRDLASICIFWTTDQYQSKLRLLKKLVDTFSRSLYRVVRFEEEITISRVDALTGLPNNQYLHDILPHIIDGCDAARPVSLLLIEMSNLSEINAKYGRAITDQMIKELAGLMKSSARVEELVSEKRPADHFIRYSGIHFIVLLEDTTSTEASTVAERIRVAVEERLDWPGGVPNWTVSIGIVTVQDSSAKAQMTLLEAEVALMYVKEHLRGNQSILFDHVPRTYRVSKLSAKVSGSLDIFDPATVLQSIAKSQRTGILTVDEPDGRKFWAFYEDGRLKKARIQPFRADVAIIEFLTTFEDGAFGFQEYSSLDADALEELHSLDATYDVVKNLDENLIDGAVAQDKLTAAKRAVPNAKLFARLNRNAGPLIAALPRSSDPPPTRMELETMAAICKYVNGRTMLNTILDKLDAVPTYLRWHAAAVLVNTKVVELSKLAVSFSL